MGKKGKMHTKAIGFGMHEINFTINGMLLMYLTYFATNSLCMSAASISFVIMISRIFDGVTDIASGMLIDRTKTRIGKARPYILAGIPASVFLALIFVVPDLSNAGKAVYIFIMYNLNNSVFLTLYNCCKEVLLKRMTLQQKERLHVLTVAGAMKSFGSIVCSSLIPLIMAKIGGSQRGWIMMACGFAVTGIICSVLCFAFCWEYKEDMLPRMAKEEKKGSVFEFIKNALQNKYLLLFMLVQFFFSLTATVSNISASFYFGENIRNMELLSIVRLGNIVLFLAMPFIPKIAEKLGKQKLMIWGFVLSAAGILLRTLGASKIILLFTGSVMESLGNAPFAFIASACIIDCMDWGERKTGVRIEALFSSFINVAMKFATGIASGVVGMILNWGHYDSALAAAGGIQPVGALNAITFLYCWGPMMIYLILAFIMSFFNVEARLQKAEAMEKS